MNIGTELRESLRRLLLPIRPDTEDDCAMLLKDCFADLGVDVSDYLNWVALKLDQWEDEHEIPGDLLLVIGKILVKSDPKLGAPLGDQYSKIHQKLKSDHSMTHSQARGFLSHSFLAMDLAKNEKMSAAQVAKLLAERDPRAAFSRQNVFELLDALDAQGLLSLDQVKGLFERDQSEEPDYFSDSDADAASDLVSEVGQYLGFNGDLSRMLRGLFIVSNPTSNTPYIQMLHFQCCIAEFYDHAMRDFYEFKPRGEAAKWLFDQYPESMADAGNPFLNNAKAVESASLSWVRSKKAGERPGAMNLLGVLEGLEQMGFAARRELARCIRLWVHRVMRLSLPAGVVLPASLTIGQWDKVLSFVSAGNTASYGILEQRVIDAMASGEFSDAEGWRSRGIGSSVNATNVSQRKIGDCDFQHPTKLMVVAFEAHGGMLSDIYVDEHLRTLRKILPYRAIELAGIADLDKWQIVLRFIAHSVTATDRPDFEIEGIKVRIEYETYGDIIARRLAKGDQTELLNRLTLLPLRERRTPTKVRQLLLDVAS